MNDSTAVATKQDIQMLLNAMNTMGKEIEERLELKLEQKLEEKHEETRRHLSILIEDAEERYLLTTKDVVSLHEDKLENHEDRIGFLEKVRLAL